MLKLKHASRRHTRDAPQYYEPRVEIALHALKNGLVGCQMLVRFLLEQQGIDWRDVGPMLDAADADFIKARTWLNKRKKKGGNHA
jgi:hypothetical protein